MAQRNPQLIHKQIIATARKDQVHNETKILNQNLRLQVQF